MRIGLVTTRAEVALAVADVAAEVGAAVVALPGWSVPSAGWAAPPEVEAGSGAACDWVLIDAAGPWPGEATAPPGADAAAVIGGDEGARMDRVPRIVVHRAGEQEVAVRCAELVGATHAIELPTGASWLVDRARGGDDPSGVLAVLGAVGGAGTSTVAMACALAVASEQACLLVDADPASAGLDLPLGIPDGAGARWADVPAGAGELVADSLRAGLPDVLGAAVLTGALEQPAAPRVRAVVRTGRTGFPRTVLDGGRGPVDALGLLPRDGVAVVTTATLAGAVGARRLVEQLPTERIVLAVRRGGWATAAEVARQVGVARWLQLPTVRGLAECAECGELASGRAARALRAMGHQVWEAAG